MFILDEKVVYPGYGVAKINRLVEKRVAGRITRFFELTFLNKDMTILVPAHNLSSVGIRRLNSCENINEVLKILSEPTEEVLQDIAASNWNKRNKDYQCKLRTGNLQEICKIYRDLRRIAAQKELSFGEKNLLQQTEALLVEEIAIVKEMGEEKAIEHLRSLANYQQQGGSAEVAKTV